MTDSLDRSEVLSRSSRGLLQVSGIVGLQIVLSLGTQVILARLVAPEHFGALAFATVFAFAVHGLINTHGDRFAIQAQGDAERLIGTTIAAELVSATALFVAVFFLASPVLDLFDRGDLVRPLQVLALTYFAIPLTKPRALIERQLRLFRARLPTLLGQVAGSVLGIVLALMGAGLWSLVAWRTSTLLIEGLILWGLAGRTIRIRFNSQDFRESLNFGWPLMASALLVFFYWNIDYAIVGRLLGDRQLGFYALAFTVSHFLLRAKTVLNAVFFPTYARLPDTEDRVRVFDLVVHATGAAYALPAVIALAAGDVLIPWIFGARWAPAVVPFQLFMVIVLVRAVSSNAIPLLHATGRTRQDLVLSFLGAALIPGFVFLLARPFGIAGAAFGVVLAGLVHGFVGFQVFVRREVGQGFLGYYGRPLAAILLTWAVLLTLRFLGVTQPMSLALLATAAGGALYAALFGRTLASTWAIGRRRFSARRA